MQSEHDTFAQNVRSALEMKDSSELTFIGTDLNARLNGLQSTFSCIAECAVSECPRSADFRSDCLRALSGSCLVAANTVISEPSHTTWRHPSGNEQQIDFVFIPDQLVASGKLLSCSVGQWGFFDCVTTSDHRHVEAVVLFQSKRACRTSPKKRKRAQFVNDAHIAAYCAAMKTELTPWDGREPASTYIEKALKLATSTVVSTSSRRASQKKPWISEEVWERMYSMNMWRRYSVAFRRRDLLLAQSLLGRLGSPVIDGHSLQDHSIGSHQALAARVKLEHGQLRKQLRACRRSWLHSNCERVDAFDKSHQSRLLHQAIKAICVTKSYRGTRLLDDQGVIASDGEVVAGKWLQYWQDHFRAASSEASDFADRSKLTPSSVRADQGEEIPFFDEDEVRRTLKHMPKWRATSDPVPAPALTFIADALAAPLTCHFNSCIRRGCVPVAYAGARITPVWKKKGSEHLCSSYRPVALLVLESKLLAKLCLSKIGPMLKYNASQYGSGHRAGVMYPQVSVLQAAAVARHRHHASATIFVDVIGAFDAVPLPLLWDEDCHIAPSSRAAAFEQRGYNSVDAQAMARYLEAHPCILSKVGVPTVVIDLLRSWGSATWLVSSMSQESAVHPHTGVLQGQNLAGLLFDLFYSDLMEDINLELATHNLGLVLPSPETRTLVLTGNEADCRVGCVAYRDDLALSLASDSKGTLIQMIGRAVSIIEAVHNKFHLRLNYSRGKTECTVNFKSPTAKGFMQGLKMLGRASAVDGPVIPVDNGKLILLAQEYPHLGRSHSQSGSIKKELGQRIAKASSAFKLYSKVLTSVKIATRTRLCLFQIYVVCHLLQHAACTPRLSDAEYHRLRSVYFWLLRGVLLERSNSHKVSQFTDEELCTKFKVPNFLTLWDRRRLRALPKLLVVDSAPLRSLLAANMDRGSVWSGLLDSLSRFQKSRIDFATLPIPSRTSFEEWCLYIIPLHDTWVNIVNAYSTVDPPKKGASGSSQPTLDETLVPAAAEENHPECFPCEEQEPDPTELIDGEDAVAGIVREFPCSLCSLKGKSAAGRAMHARRKHGLQTPHSLRLRSAVCPACSIPWETRHRALDHLKNSKRCGVYVMENIDPMSNEELALVLERERGANYSWSRRTTPKPGPKPPGYKPPLNVVTPLFASQEHAASATMLD
eukprot:3010502-Amphidinium_carterae.1